jgi:hypothetical protein
MGWGFIAASLVLAALAIHLDRQLLHDLPPVLRTPTPRRRQSSATDFEDLSEDLDQEILQFVEAVPVRWRRELFPPRYRGAIDRFCTVLLLAVASLVVGGTLVSLSGAS